MRAVLVMLVLAMATGKGVAIEEPHDDCIVRSGTVFKSTFKSSLDLLYSSEKEESVDVNVKHAKGKCTLKLQPAKQKWMKVTINLSGNINLILNNSSNPGNQENQGERCKIDSNETRSIKYITTASEVSAVFNCSNGPVFFQFSNDSDVDKLLVPWYDKSVNFTLEPLDDTKVKYATSSSTCGEGISLNKSTEHRVEAQQNGKNLKVNNKDVNIVSEQVDVVRVCKNNLAPVVIKQFLDPPVPQDVQESRESPWNWIYIRISIAVLLGILIGVFLCMIVQKYCKPRTEKTSYDHRTPAVSDVVTVENDMYEPLEEYQSHARMSNAAAGTSPGQNGNGIVENDIYESFNEVLERPHPK